MPPFLPIILISRAWAMFNNSKIHGNGSPSLRQQIGKGYSTVHCETLRCLVLPDCQASRESPVDIQRMFEGKINRLSCASWSILMNDRKPFDVNTYTHRIQNGPCFICEMVHGRVDGNHIIYQDDLSEIGRA